MKKPWKKSEKIMFVSAFTVILFVIIGVAYGYFSIIISGNEDATQTKITTGLLNIDFEAEEYFNNPNMMLIDDLDKETDAEIINFSVENMNDSTRGASYLIYIKEMIISDNFKSADFKWELVKDGTVYASGNFASVGSSNEVLLTPTAVSLPLTTTHNYELRAWLSMTDQDQASLLNGSFKGKVSVVAVAQ